MQVKRLLGALLALALTFGMLPGMGSRAYAELPTVTYREASLSGSAVTYAQKTISDYKVVGAGTTTFEDDGWYVVTAPGESPLQVNDRIKVSGTAHLILLDGTVMYANAGISVGEGATLNIYGQSADNSGVLYADGASWCAGIGGYIENGGVHNAGTVTVHGGCVVASGAEDSAGIGGGGAFSAGGTVTVFGGTVDATGFAASDEDYGGAGIGGGDANGGDVRIYGGSVTATGGGGGAVGIGKGEPYTGSPTDGDLTLGTGVGMLVSDDGKAWTAYDGSTRKQYMKTGTLHDHDLAYSATGDTITAACVAEGCDDPAYSVTLTVVKPTLTTYGETGKSEEATLSGADAFNAATGKGVSATDVKYYEATRDGDAYNKGDELASAPTDAGDYLAEVALEGVKTGAETIGDVAASVGYTIAKAESSITSAPTAGQITYGQTLAQSALAGGETDVPGSFAWKDPTIAPAVADSQSTGYDVVFTPADANHATAECEVTLTVNKAAPDVTAPTAKDLAYDGSAQELVGAGTTDGGTMSYALGEGAKSAPADAAFSASVPTATEAGTYYVWYRVAGDDNHLDAESACVTANIARADIAKAKVTLKKASYAYDGKAKEPGVKSVKLGGRTLKEGTDYAVSYKDNKSIGTATVTIAGKGNYEGSARAAFSIKPAKARLRTVGKTASKGFSASWAKVAGARSYELQWRKAGGKWKTVSAKGTSKLVDGLKPGALYQFRVRAVAGDAKGAWSNVSCRYLAKVSGVKVTVGKSGTVTATWKADPKANAGYVVVVRYQKGGGIVARVSVAKGKTKATVKVPKSGKKHWVEVRPVREQGGKTYAGVLRGTWAE